MVRASKRSEDGAFQDPFLASPHRARLQGGEPVGKAALTCRSLLISVGRAVPATLNIKPLIQTGTMQRWELNRGRRGTRRRAAALPRGHDAAQVGGYRTMGLTGPRNAHSLVTNGKAMKWQRTSSHGSVITFLIKLWFPTPPRSAAAARV